MRLFDLTEQYNDILDLLEDDPGNEALLAALHGLEGKVEEKVENIIKLVKTLEGEAKIIDEEAKRLSQRASSKKAHIERLKTYTHDLLNQAELERIKGKLFNVWLQNNPPSVMVLDESQVPKSFFVTPDPVLQKKAILEAWKEGTNVPGVEIRQEKSLRVR